MRAAVYLDAGNVVVEDVPDPEIHQPTDAVVRVVRSCVCGSDLWAYRDTFKRAERSRLGHEFIGEVVETGADVSTVKPGDLVIAPFSYGDGTCPACREGLPTSCPNGGGFGAPGHDGGQGEIVRVPYADANLVVAPGGVSAYDDRGLLKLLALTDVMGTGLHGAMMAGVSAGSTVAVVGDGAVGLCAVLAATAVLAAERVILLSRNPSRQDVGKLFGAAEIVPGRGDAAKDGVLDLTDGRGAPHVVEAVGTPQSWETSIAIVRDGGQVGAVGVPHTAPTIPTMPLIGRNLGVRAGIAPVRSYLPDLLRRVLEDGLDPSPVFDLTLPLDQTPQAYAAMDQRTAIKVALIP